jgi:uncharacterized protein (TIGR02284 family)
MTDRQVRNTLRRLYRVAEAGEKGFATAATNVPNPGLKVLFKTFAAQRAQYKHELLDELHRMGQKTPPGSSIPGMVHRGRVAIFAGMSGDQASCERVILREAALGERVAVNAYAKAMDEDLPAPIRERVARQMEEVRLARQQVNLLLGQDDQRALVQLFDTEARARQAVHALEEAGFSPASIQQIDLGSRELYPGRGATVPETVLSGAVGGARGRHGHRRRHRRDLDARRLSNDLDARRHRDDLDARRLSNDLDARRHRRNLDTRLPSHPPGR